MSDGAPPVVIARYSSDTEAQSARLLLASHQIECRILNQNHSYSTHFNVMMDLIVYAEDELLARHILGQDLQEPAILCPRCGSAQIETRKARGLFRLLDILLLGMATGLFVRLYRCEDCDHQWNKYF